MNPKRFTILLGLTLLTPFCASTNFTDPFLVPRMLYFQGVSAVLIALGCFVFRKEMQRIRFGSLEIAFIGFVAYLSISTLVSEGSGVDNLFFISWLLLLGFYFVVRGVALQDHGLVLILMSLLMACALFESGYGILQHLEIVENTYSTFGATGTWLNPGPYGIYLSAVLPVCLGVFLYEPRLGIRGLAGLTMLSIMVVLPLSESRTAWLAAGIGCGAVLLFRYSGALAQYINTPVKRIVLAGFLTIAFGFAAYFLYQYKIDSVHGRLFIYKTAMEIIGDHLLFGVGFDNYAHAHNEYQAAWFSENPEINAEAYAADNVVFVFNEYLQMIAELGLTGFLFFVTLIVFFVCIVYQNVKAKSVPPVLVYAVGSILAILFSALFSYPFHEISILIVMVVMLGIISSCIQKHVFRFSLKPHYSTIILIVVGLGAVWFVWGRMERYHAEKQWKKAYLLLASGNTELALDEYEAIYPTMKQNELFLYNYGVELSYLGHYAKSINLLKEAEPRLNDQDLNLHLAMSYWGNGDFEKSEGHFKKAVHIVPYKYIPRYRLLSFYAQTGQTEKAIAEARFIINMKPKVPSETVDEIKQAAREFLDGLL